MFSNGSGFQIYGGNFYDVHSGDINLHTHQHLTIRDRTLREVVSQASLTNPATLTVVDDSGEGYGRELSGVVRNTRHAAGWAPYGMASRRHILTRSPPSSHEDRPVLLASNSNAISPLSFHRPSLDPSSERLAESNQSATSTPILHHSARPQYSSHAARQPQHTTFSTRPSLDRLSIHPVEPAGSSRDTSSGRDPSAQYSQGGTFITARMVNHIQRHGETGINILHRAVALEALYDSAESFPQPKCHPDTRTKILDDLYNWAIGRVSNISICWLHGPAGAGKSAIMQTLCQRLKDSGRLGGSFFFKRGHVTRGNAKVLFVTLAYQLALHISILKGPISESAQDDPSVVGRSMEIQLQNLIVQPCKSPLNPRCESPILLIDGLDECEGENIQQELLRLISNAVHENPGVLRILIASRPEPHIRETFERPSINRLYRRVNINQSFADVEKYLRDEFYRIYHEHRDTMEEISTPWPSESVLDLLLEKSSGYFIYASTVIKFIDDRDFRPTERLSMVVDWQNIPADSNRPFEALDQLYTQILSTARARPRLVRILCVLAHFPKLYLAEIEQLLELDHGDLRLSLRRLHSVLQVPSDDSAISVYHASFRDFLADPARSNEFCVGTLERRKELAYSVLKAMYDVSTSDPLPSNSNNLFWWLGCSGIEYLTSVPPDTDFLPLLRSIDPVFLWQLRTGPTMERMIDWLKKMEPTDAVENLPHLWEDYQVFNLYSDGMFDWYTKPAIRTEQLNQLEYNELFSQFPQLLKVLQAGWMCYMCSLNQPPGLFDICLVLGIPWSEMRSAVIQPLKDNRTRIPLLFSSANTAALRCQTVRIDLARGFGRLLKKTANGDLPHQLSPKGVNWCRLVRSCPPCPGLLEDLRGLRPSSLETFSLSGERYGWDEFLNLISWLRSFPEGTQDLISVWESHAEAMYPGLSHVY
ncbi:WD40 repeat-like protein [Mycena venus]|uniref:WD40 repeat-like protein n=1 Tax=Mycena venus TaxID=2733690 RepID=A0A8H6YKT3_9AGAR|nr:WD40 repeat-like protein [Mycena venus]